MGKLKTLILSIALLAMTLGLQVQPASSQAMGSNVTELVTTDTKVGTGSEALLSDSVWVHFTGWIYDATTPDHKAKEINTTRNRPKPPAMQLGMSPALKGLQLGIVGMKAGGQRTILIPPSLGYGKAGEKNGIPADAALIFEVELIKLQPATPDF